MSHSRDVSVILGLMGRADEKIVREMTRLNMRGKRYVLEVAMVEWPHPHQPWHRWKLYHSWERLPEPSEIAAIREMLLMDQRYFTWCVRCRQVVPTGCMHDHDTCQSCAERFLGVIH